MTHDYLADKCGVLEIEFREYNTNKIIGNVRIEGLRPYQRISRDLIVEGSP